MNFGSPLYLLGLIGMAIPVIIHFWKMRRAKTVRFGAIRYLLQSEEVTRRRRKFWEYLLLLVRMLLIAAVSLSLARPFRLESVPALSFGSGQKSLVVVLDDSLSMQRGGLFAEARGAAFSALNQLTDLDQAGLILPCRGMETELGRERERIRKSIRDAQPTFERANMVSAIARAQEMLGRAGAKSKKILVITDLQKAGFADAPALGDFDGEIYFYDLGKSSLEANYALGPVELSRESLAGEQSVKARVSVYDFADEPVEARLALSLGGQAVARGSVLLKRWSVAEKNFVVNLREDAGAEGKVELENPDALALDNQSYFHLRGGGRVRTLVVDGDWSTEVTSRESFYLERALNPRLYALSRIDPEVVSENGLEQVQLDNFQVIVLADCFLKNQAQASRLKDFVANGGGLLIALGEKVNADRYNSLFSDLLPRELREVKVSFAGAASAREFQPVRLDTSFIGSSERHPVLKPFSSAGEGDPAHAGFSKFFLLYQELAPKGQVILKLTDGTPMMVEKAHGRGNVIMFASSIGPGWNDLCIHPAFLPLLHQTILYLARSLFEVGGQGAEVGEQVELALPSGKSGAFARTSRGTEMSLAPEKQAGQNLVRISRLTEPGIYYFWYLPGPEPRTMDNADFILAVNPDPRESDFRKISAAELKKITPAAAVYISSEKGVKSEPGARGKTSSVKRPYHASFLLALVLLAGVELLILARSGLE